MFTQRTRPRALGIAAATILALSGCTAADDTNEESSSRSAGEASVPRAPVFEGEFTDYRTRPDLPAFGAAVTPGPAIDSAFDGAIILSPRNTEVDDQSIANAILDRDGEPLWLQGVDGLEEGRDYVQNALVQTYEGEPVLTWWEGVDRWSWGHGDVVIADSSYREIHRVSAAGGLAEDGADFHEFRITDDDTMLWVAYVPTPADLSEIGGPQDGWVLDGVVQEVDIASGELLFEWSALDHVPVTDTIADFFADRAVDDPLGTREDPVDYFHINSVAVDDDGSLLISARATHAVYSIDAETGDVNWTLGGKASDFDLSDDAYFSWQHDAQREDDGTIRIFDNAATPAYRDDSRVLWLALDEEAGEATIARQIDPPEPRLSDYMANAERLPNGNLFVGWGWEHFYSEYTADGELVLDATHAPFDSYRAYSAEWTGTPSEPPALVVDDDGAHVSWNGATEVAQWRVLAGADEDTMTEQAVVDRDGFETVIPLPGDAPHVVVEALDASGEVIGSSYTRSA